VFFWTFTYSEEIKILLFKTGPFYNLYLFTIFKSKPHFDTKSNSPEYDKDLSIFKFKNIM